MKVVVLGAGVTGVTSAWYLAKAGHEVTVLEREAGPALQTSFANAGELSYGYSSPWAAPDVPLKAIRWLFMKRAPLILRPTLDPRTLGWLLQMLGNCTAGRYAVNKDRMVRIADYSRDCHRALREETGIQFDHRALGTLEVFRTQRQFDHMAKDTEVLRQRGVPFEILDADGCLQAEPGIAKDKLVGGLRLPEDETGDCFMFTNALAEKAVERGVSFRYGVDIHRFKTESGRIRAIETSEGDIEADVFVGCMGSYTPRLIRPLGLRLPVYPVKGYSLTAPVLNEARAPVSTVMDEAHKVAMTRLGQRVRVGGMAEIAGFSHDLPKARTDTLSYVVNDLFEGAADLSAGEYWTGLRPMTPDGTPVIGRTAYDNLYLNTGHGTLGWTMSCGSGRVLSDLVSGQTPEIETADLSLARYS
ncbi:D-amino acid dehydrogenase [Asticcacaulis tiandongensis]|uniref:D-amino acid dehydrogenase n=1 Tax=Asticcacaulis tiandongensis TaxID=2565365 RepID=UPI0011274D62|nr:D-amino acid dehydrogenase [Asticcacaulis tiandongensis]